MVARLSARQGVGYATQLVLKGLVAVRGCCQHGSQVQIRGGDTCDWRRPGEHVWETKRVEES